jgi:L-cysteine desulfidase
VKVAACASEAVYAAMYAMDGSVIGVSDGINSSAAEDTAKNLAKLSHEALDTLDMKVIEIMQTKK